MGCCPTRSVPVRGSALAQTRYQARLRRRLPTATRVPPTSRTMPSGVSTSAKPAPVAGSRREITVCGPSSGRVGQIVASTVRAAGSVSAAAASTRPYEPGQACWTREAKRPSKNSDRSSYLGGGAPGLGSPRTIRTSVALYGLGPALVTLKAIFSPTLTETLSA